MRRLFLLSLLMTLLLATTVQAQDVPNTPLGSQYRLVEVASGFNRPLFVTGAGDASSRLFIMDQFGHIWIMQDGALLPQPFLDVSGIISTDANERGLLGLAFHPNYAENGQFYIYYTDVSGDTVVARYLVSADDPNLADPASATYVLRADQPYPNHNGGHMSFGPDGYLYIGTGDGGSQGDPQRRAQNPNDLLGKILRLDVDNGNAYAIPADNPALTNSGLPGEIWALGLRNPWRFSFDRLTGDLYIADVGQNQWEEINFQPAGVGGLNYGWNIMEGTRRYSGEPVIDGLTDPFFEYNHSNGCSVTGGYVYRGQALPALQGVYFFADYCSGLIWSSYRDAAGVWQTNLFMDTDYSISSFGEDEAGELYILNHGGSVLRLEAAA